MKLLFSLKPFKKLEVGGRRCDSVVNALREGKAILVPKIMMMNI